MKNFIAVFDGYKMSDSTLNYAIQLARVENAHLVGVFLDDFIYRSYNVYNVLTSNENYQTVMKQLDAADQKKRDAATVQFQKSCTKAGIQFTIHRDKSIALQELKQESMFADLVIISEYETFSNQQEQPPTRFIKELLSGVQCPVLVVPLAFKPVDKIVLLYDGKPSSLYAIKMFSYLFSSLHQIPVEVFTVNGNATGSARLPDNKLMKEFIKRHFPKAQYTITKGEAEPLIINHLKKHNENVLVVLGAYQRSEPSRWFKSSMADVLMKKNDTPLFIAHHK